jgi:hypothetical protein
MVTIIIVSLNLSFIDSFIIDNFLYLCQVISIIRKKLAFIGRDEKIPGLVRA